MKHVNPESVRKPYRSSFELGRKAAFSGSKEEIASFGPGRHFEGEISVCLYSVSVLSLLRFPGVHWSRVMAWSQCRKCPGPRAGSPETRAWSPRAWSHRLRANIYRVAFKESWMLELKTVLGH